MRVLAIESATMLGGVAIVDEADGLLVEVRLSVKSMHSERLMTSVEDALRLTGLRLGDMDALAVSIGPGAFTGLRIGLSTVKGLAFGARLPVVAVPTLDAYAALLPYAGMAVCPLLDARKKEVYAAAYDTSKGGAPVCLMAAMVLGAGELPGALKKAGVETSKGIVFAGQGAHIYRDALMEGFGQAAHFAPEHVMVPSAASVATLGLRMALDGQFTDPETLGPLYIRKSEAETAIGG